MEGEFQNPPNPEKLTRIGRLLKPFGLLGEIKAQPETFDPSRINQLEKVFVKKNQNSWLELSIKSARQKDQFWYLKFEDILTPEKAKTLSGAEIFIPDSQRLPLPDNMVYISDVVGMDAYNPQNQKIGVIKEVMQNANVDLLVVQTDKAEIPVPWNEHFVMDIEEKQNRVIVDIESLRPLYEN